MRSKKGSIVFANHVPTCNRFFISHDSTSEREKRKSSRQKETVHNNNLKKEKKKKNQDSQELLIIPPVKMNWLCINNNGEIEA